MRIGLLRNNPCFNGNYNTTISTLGHNTGNLAFWSAIEKLLNPDRISYSNISDKLNQMYDKIVITDLIWLNNHNDLERLDYLLKVYHNGVIPISVGVETSLRNSDFYLAPYIVDILRRIQERSVIGVRGEYTASVLNKCGIKNIDIIGCPSMYYMNNENFNISDAGVDNISWTSNFKTFYYNITVKERDFLSYCIDNKSFFVEQTHSVFTLKQASNDEKFFEYINNWLEYNSHIFYTIEDWNKNISHCNFSMGARFHGNVMALRNNIKSLFLICDSRTKELAEFFEVPYIELEQFDKTKDIRYYYDLADYSKFNKSYKTKFDTFKRFLFKNGINLSEV